MSNKPFCFNAYDFNPETGVLKFSYDYGDDLPFEETFTFPLSGGDLSPHKNEALDNAFRLLFYICGISYYKAYASNIMKFKGDLLPDQTTADLLYDIYTKGLAEFAHENNIDIRERVHINHKNKTEKTESPISLNNHALVAVGGGKDSIVTIESLKAQNTNMTLFSIGHPNGAAKPIADTVAAAQLPHIHVARTISPQLIELNKQPDVMNGHIPITAIVSVTAIICAILYDYNAVILSNENSASIPNLNEDGWSINHQYSKSFEFEKLLSSYVHTHIAANLDYFSYLRPWSEVAIAKRFSQAKEYHAIFHSCNAAFHQDITKRQSHWCCDCPKCRFVFLSLAPFMPQKDLISVFGKNMLDDETQLEGFQKICGQTDFKPFECVGTVEESALLMEKLSHDPDWSSAAIIKLCTPKTDDFENRFSQLFEKESDHIIPKTYNRSSL